MFDNKNKGRGAFPVQTLHELKDGGFLQIHENQIKPASFDTVISDEIYHLPRGAFQVKKGQSIFEFAKDNSLIKDHSIQNPLEVGEAYLIKIEDKVNLMSGVYGYANPKSSSGRLDLHCRLLADCVGAYDTLPGGWKGDLWVLVIPKSFPIILNSGDSLNQIRLFNKDARLSRSELEFALGHDNLLYKKPIYSGALKQKIFSQDLIPQDYDLDSLLLSIDLEGPLPGYVAKNFKNQEPIDISRIGNYPWENYFSKLEPNEKGIELDSGKFYILSTWENVLVPNTMACEMRPTDDRLGDYKAHYAGFIDPGWGMSEGGLRGLPLTLEVRPFGKMTLFNQQPIARIKYEWLVEPANVNYQDFDSNYKVQTGPKLAKQFKV